ncbi:hypothetical protein Pla123a_06480 [Posidoniimonas polymericola]|uniref:Ferric reductase like transmembrane component n=1 Tax=Posidoniimonas polymericola TaxID=2528002 RepID=A0A5C5ZG43_9BACT|nr:hypothetical protein [Posidoniimonas polymericola]TWT85841.1 hypothetical protein Pla123a_06480 [Posidoniimonas polymericola]
MNKFARRRYRCSAAALALVAALWAWLRWVDGSLGATAYQSGYVLYGLIVFLAAYNARKKLPGLPLGSSRAWLQLHLYVGVATVALLGMHISWRLPNGYFETALAGVFAATVLSGVWGLYLTRTIPRQLARTSEQIVFERIPRLRNDLLRRSRAAVLAGVSQTGSTTLAEFYSTRVDNYLAAPRGVGYFLRPSSGVRRRVMAELTDLRRFLTQAEEVAGETLFAIIRKKDDLDFHQARQGLLKGWLFLHIALTYTLLTLATLHGVVALAMRGGHA